MHSKGAIALLEYNARFLTIFELENRVDVKGNSTLCQLSWSTTKFQRRVFWIYFYNFRESFVRKKRMNMCIYIPLIRSLVWTYIGLNLCFKTQLREKHSSTVVKSYSALSIIHQHYSKEEKDHLKDHENPWLGCNFIFPFTPTDSTSFTFNMWMWLFYNKLNFWNFSKRKGVIFENQMIRFFRKD